MKNVLIVFFYQTFVRFSSGSILDWHFSLHQETQLDENKIFDFLTRTQSERNKITQLSTFVVWLFLLQPFRHVRLFINKSTFHLRLFCISDIVSCNFFHEGVIFCVTFCFFFVPLDREDYTHLCLAKNENQQKTFPMSVSVMEQGNYCAAKLQSFNVMMQSACKLNGTFFTTRIRVSWNDSFLHDNPLLIQELESKINLGALITYLMRILPRGQYLIRCIVYRKYFTTDSLEREGKIECGRIIDIWEEFD